jgi:hypothetical protein
MLEMFGDLGDFLGGIGVLVSLVYLAIQVRQNTVAARADSYQAVVGDVSDWSRELSLNPEICRILIAGSADFDGLEPIERLQFSLAMSAFFRNMENVHSKFLAGVIDESVWEGWANRTRAFLAAPGMRSYWEQNALAFSPAFRRFFNEPDQALDRLRSFDQGFR